jgi:hypothetical protein
VSLPPLATATAVDRREPMDVPAISRLAFCKARGPLETQGTVRSFRHAPKEVFMLRLVCSALVAGALVLVPAAFSPHFSDQAQAEAMEKAEKAKKRTKRTLTEGQKAARARQKQCGQEWRELRKAGKVEKGMTWPKFWSACNRRLKSVKGA